MRTRRVEHEGITEYELDNGLRVLLIPDPSQATVTVNLTIFAGSACEGYGETGAAHLLEHLAFKGSPDFPNVPAALNEHGASWNGTTWTDRTNYFETMPASDANLEFGVHFEAARLTRCFINKADLDSEMTVVRNEFEAGENSPTQILSERINATAFLFHGYGHASIGARSDIENVPIERLQSFYRRWYRTDNAMLIVAGRFAEPVALDAIDRYFGILERPLEPLTRNYTVEPPQDGERAVTLRRVGEVGAVGVAYHVPGAAHPDLAVVEVLSEILTATPTGRLHRQLVETQRAVRVYAYVYQFRDPSLLELVVEVRKDRPLMEIKDELIQAIEVFHDVAPDAAEVERARNALVKDKVLLFGKSERLSIELSEWAAMGEWRLFFVHQARLEAVTADDVQRVARQYLRRANRTVGMYVPSSAAEKVEIPPVGDLATVLATLPSRANAGAAIEALPLDAGVLESRTHRLQLGGGAVKLALLPKRNRGGLVSGRVSLSLGNEQALHGRTLTNEYVAAMLDRGTRHRDRAGLKDELDRLHADLRFLSSPQETLVSFLTTGDHVSEVLTLVFEMLREPRFDTAELGMLREEKMAELEESKHEPFALAELALVGHLFPPGHLRHTPGIEAQIRFLDKLDQARLQDFHADFYGAGEAYVALVGDFSPDDVARASEVGLVGWNARVPTRRVELRAPAPALPVVQEIETPDKENALTVAGRTFPLHQSNADYEPLLLSNYLLGGEALNSRIAQRLRQKDGLCYGAGTSVTVDSVGDLGGFTFWAISAPSNAGRVEQGFRDELERLRRDGFDEAELERGRASFLEVAEVRLSRDGALASEMIEHMVRGTTFTELQRLRDGIRDATSAKVAAVVDRYLDPAQVALFRAGDFAAHRATNDEPDVV